MDVYNYIAHTDPALAGQIINDLGYKVVNKKNMGANLKNLVAQEGEPALKVILENHPDKDVILEVCSTVKSGEHYDCDCNGCKEGRIVDKFLNASGGGSEKSEAKKVENNFSIVFLAGILVLSFAILSKK